MKYYFDWDYYKKEYDKKDGLRRYPLFARLGCFIAIVGILAAVGFYSYLLLILLKLRLDFWIKILRNQISIILEYLVSIFNIIKNLG